MLEVGDDGFTNVIVFNSLSKRSNLPGLRVGFAAGDRAFLGAFLELRNVAAPQVPVPLQHVAAHAYADEAHVTHNRALYAEKFDLADQILGDRFGYRRPDGGFFLWLDVSERGGGEEAAAKLWREAGLRVVPGGYLARRQRDGSNPAAAYVRIAMVPDKNVTAEALHRLVATLG
jgi:aspartate/methionine/tyrosine aminotransferase